MAMIPTQKSPRSQPALKPQEQDSPTANMGRYGLFRQLLKTQIPHLSVENPVSSSLDNPFRSRKSY